MNEETIQAARAAFKRDPETACQAMLGCSAEEMFVTALRGCNQHKHKPGCPDAEGGGSATASSEPNRRAEFKSIFKANRGLYADSSFGVSGDDAFDDASFNMKKDGPDWQTGTITAGGKQYKVQIQEAPRKYKDEPSTYGIEGGDIIKCWIADSSGREIVNYDRGWDVKPRSPENKKLLRTLLNKFNNV